MRRRAVLLVVATCIFMLAQLHGYAHELTHLQSDSSLSECMGCDQLIAFDDNIIPVAIFPGILLALYVLCVVALTEKAFLLRVISRARSPPPI